MTMPQSRTPTRPSLTQDVLHAARYHLGNRWVLLGLGSLAVATGLFFGGWAWLVAAGVPPPLLFRVAFLLLWGFGGCLLWRSPHAPAAAPPDASDPRTTTTFCC